jgi:hypothetical protein
MLARALTDAGQANSVCRPFRVEEASQLVEGTKEDDAIRRIDDDSALWTTPST